MKVYHKKNMLQLLYAMLLINYGAAVLIAIISAVIAAASTTMGIVQHNKGVKAQQKVIDQNAKSDLQQLAEKRSETDEKAADLRLQRQLQAARERGRVTVAQSDAGIMGNSTLKSLNNVLVQESMDLSTIEANRASATRQIGAQQDATVKGARANIAAINTDAIGAGLGAMKLGINTTEGAYRGYQMGKAIDGE